MGKKHRPGPSKSGLEDAMNLHRLGRFAEAEQIYLAHQNNPKAVEYLGILRCQTGRQASGIQLLAEAARLSPNDPETLANYAVVLHEQGAFQDALHAVETAIRLKPDNADLLDKRGFVLQDLGRNEEAITSFEHALTVNPNHGDARFHLGYSRLTTKDFPGAEAAFRAVLKLRPNDEETYINLGNALLGQMKGAEAIACHRRAIQLRPSAPAYHALAVALSAMGDLREALGAAKLATQLAPQNADYHAHVAALRMAMRDTSGAMQAYGRAIELEPNNDSIAIKLAMVTNQIGNYDEAIAALEPLVERSPAAALAQAIFVPIIPESTASIEAGRRATLQRLDALIAQNQILEDPSTEVDLTNFYWSYHYETELPLQKKIVEAYRIVSPDLFYEAPTLARPRTGKLRVGVVSAFMRRHTIGKLFLPLIAGLKSEEIEVLYFDCARETDDWTQRLNESVDAAYKLNADLDTCREFIGSMDLDALFYPEIGMNPFTYYLAFSRLAPLQFMTWGHPVSTALPHMDCFLSSEDLETPGSEDQYSEQLVKFPSLMTVFERPSYQPVTRADLGLPASARIYACPQALFKFHPDFDLALQEILVRDPDGILVLLTGNEPQWDDLLMSRWRRVMASVADRIRILRRLNLNEFIGLCDVADVVLDTFYFGGGNSSLEAFSVGAPIVTLPGSMLRGRITYAQYKAMDMPDLIASDSEDYVDKAVRVANDDDFRASLKTKVLERNEVLFGNQKPIEELRSFLRTRCR